MNLVTGCEGGVGESHAPPEDAIHGMNGTETQADDICEDFLSNDNGPVKNGLEVRH